MIKRIFLVACMQILTIVVYGQYTNPVLNKNMPDPSVVRAADGQFYVYATVGSVCPFTSHATSLRDGDLRVQPSTARLVPPL